MLICSFILCHGFIMGFFHGLHSILLHSHFPETSCVLKSPRFRLTQISFAVGRGSLFFFERDELCLPHFLISRTSADFWKTWIPPPFFSPSRVSIHLSPVSFGGFGLVVLLIASGCPLAHPAVFDRQPVHACFFQSCG